MSDIKQLSAVLNSELDVVLSNLDGSDETRKYLKNYFRYLVLRRCVKWIVVISIVISVVSASIYYIPFLNWNASAIGRLVLIKLVLPYYDWQYLYKSRCLVEKSVDVTTTSDGGYTDDGGFNSAECAVCENLGNIWKYW